MILSALYSTIAQSTTSEFRLTKLYEVLANPLVLGALAVLFAVYLFFYATNRGYIFGIAILVWFVMPAPFVYKEELFPIAFPFNLLVEYARSIAFAVLASLLLPALFPTRECGRAKIPLFIYALTFFQLVFLAKFVLLGHAAEGIPRIGVTLAVFSVLAIGLSRRLNSYDDCYKLVLALTCLLGVYCLANIAATMLDVASVLRNGRFHGIAGNANHAGIIFAALLPAAYVTVTVNKGLRSAWWRLLAFALIVTSALFLGWTGSRSSAWTATLITLIYFRRRLKVFIPLCIFGILMSVYLAAGLLEESSESAGRLLTTDNTRATEWAYVMERFAKYPYLGDPDNPFVVYPGSYITILAQMGIVGVIVALPMIVLAITFSLRMLQIAKRLPVGPAAIADACGAVILGFGFNAIFEGSLFSILSFSIVAIMCFGVLGQSLLQVFAVNRNYSVA